jgi:hypothetical protein
VGVEKDKNMDMKRERERERDRDLTSSLFFCLIVQIEDHLDFNIYLH